MSRHRLEPTPRPRPALALVLLLLLGPLAGCPDDIASTDLAQPKDAAVQAQDLGAKD